MKEIEKRKFLMQSLMANFVEYFNAIAKFLFLKGRMDTKPCLYPTFEIFLNFLHFLIS